MTRPGMVRADTLDLQDQDAPSAQDHSQHNLPTDAGGHQLGPHQAAEIRSVNQERRSEELNLREAWDQAHLSPDQQHDQHDQHDHHDHLEADGFNDEQLHEQQHNGLHGEEGDQGDDEDADHSSDEDMMDRMSSSPSIDDGAYLATPPASAEATQWPPRSSSLTPTRGTLNRSASSTPDSSPFVEYPIFLPLAVFLRCGKIEEEAEEEEEEVDEDEEEPLGQDKRVHLHHMESPVSTTRSQDSSPFVKTPDHFPLLARKSNADSGTHIHSTSSFSCPDHHHLSGEYHGQYDDYDNYDDFQEDGYNDYQETCDDDYDEDAFADESSEEDNADQQTCTITTSTTLPRSARHYFTGSATNLVVFGSDSSPEKLDIRELLLPDDDPLLGDDMSSNAGTMDSDDSWATISDASMPCEDNDSTNMDNHRDDDSDDFLYSDPRCVDSGFGGECLRETEDIDFDFVYALHTFVATVEGQANATKGDTMVLLDDSNSYWWLVRLVKDQSIGYLPAEHIETPTERLARLNKHRNVDLSQAMLGDNMEKSKNPLRKAMKRRNAKTVQFTAPTYVEASDYEYDTEDEENAMIGDMYTNGALQGESGAAEVEHAEHRESTSEADELKSRMSDSSSSDDIRSTIKDINVPNDEPLGSPSLVDQTEAAPLKSRKGTPRNADSFLKDESAEPRRITLTPGILRDESNGNSGTNSLEKTRSTSFDSLEKVVSPPEKVKDEKKKKEKKQGMLSGLFKSKKKDKKGKDEDVAPEGDRTEKVSTEIQQNPSGRSSPVLERNQSPAEKRSKLQKVQPPAINTSVVAVVSQDSPKILSPRQVITPVSSEPQLRSQQRPLSPMQTEQADKQHPSHFYAELEGSQVAYEAPTGQEDHMRDVQSRQSTHSPDPVQPPSALQPSSSMSALTSAITNRMRSGSHSEEPRRQKVKKAKTRVELDDFDEVSEDDEDHEDQEDEGERERLSESPVEITHNTFMHGTEAVHIPMNIDEADQNSSTQGLRTPDERGSDEGERSSSPSMLDMPSESEHHEPRDGNKTLILPGAFDSSSSENVSDITDDDPTPTHSKPQSPSLVMQHHPGLPNLQQTPTPPPAHSAPFPPVQPQRQASLQTDVSARQTPDHTARQLPTRGDSTSSTVSHNYSASPSTASTASKDTNASFSNASLRAWLDGGEGNDIRDMLVVIHDKSNVTPVKGDHPLMKGLWDEERVACGRMMGELDDMLGKWLGKKKSSRSGTPTPAPNGTLSTAGISLVGA